MATIKAVIRRSHTKSKIGCKSCKSRHIKCDEFRPKCRNCLISKRVCTYPTTIAGEGASQVVPEFSWPTAIEQSCQTWQAIGKPPFPFLSLPPSPSWHSMSMGDLRYMHQLALVASILEISQKSQMCLWWSEFPFFFQLAARFDFVAHTKMALSAERLAFITRSTQALEDSTRYKALALAGLRLAIHSFSKENADAILCASISLSYQAHDWRGLMVIMEGIAAVTRQIQMGDWARESGFFRYLKQRPVNRPLELTSTPSYSGPVQGVSDRSTLSELLFPQGIQSLNQLASSVQDNTNLSAMIRQLRDILRVVYEREPSSWSVSEQYRLVFPFTSWMTKYSISFVSISEGDAIVLMTLAHFYAVGVTLAIALPAIDTPAFTSIRMKGIVEADRILQGKPGIFCGSCDTSHYDSELMSYPLSVVHMHQRLWENRSHIVEVDKDLTEIY